MTKTDMVISFPSVILWDDSLGGRRWQKSAGRQGTPRDIFLSSGAVGPALADSGVERATKKNPTQITPMKGSDYTE
jgi:hypothetical protein